MLATAMSHLGATVVECPICQVRVLEQQINNHLDLMHDSELAPEPDNKRQKTSGPFCDEAFSDGSARPSMALHTADPSTEQLLRCPTVTIDEPEPRAPPSQPDIRSETLLPRLETSTATEIQRQAQLETSPTSKPATSADSQETLQMNTEIASVRYGGIDFDADVEASASGLQPEDHLRACLLGSRTHALRTSSDDAETMHGKAQELCASVKSEIERRMEELKAYSDMARPSDRDQQRERNATRHELEDVARAALSSLTSMLSVSSAPVTKTAVAEAAQIEKIDRVVHMLRDFRAETVEQFQKLKEDEAIQREASDAAALALRPSLNCLDRFVQQLVAEVQEETARAVQVHTEKLEELQRELTRFVNANDSPQRNPIFAKTLEDIDSTKRVLEEHRSQSLCYIELVENWEKVLAEMPAQEAHVPPRPPSMLDRILGRS